MATSLSENAQVLDVIWKTYEHQNAEQISSQKLAFLEAMELLLCLLPLTLIHEENDRLLQVIRELLPEVKRALMSRDPKLQVSGGQLVLTLVLRNDATIIANVFSADLGELLAEAFNTTHHPLLQVVSRCVWMLCKNAPAHLYARGLAGRILQGLLRALHLVLTQQGAGDVTLGGLTLLSSLLQHSHAVQIDLSQHGPQVISLLKQAMKEESSIVIKDAAARALANLLLVIPRGAALAWPDVAQSVREAAKMYEPASSSCLVLRLARGAIIATAGKGVANLEMQQWAEEVIIHHATSFVLKNPVDSMTCASLLAALETLFNEPSWQGAPRLSRTLAKHGFLNLANQMINDAMLVKRGASILAHVLLTIVSPMLGAAVTHQRLCEGLRDLPEPWLSKHAPPQTQEARDAALVLSYGYARTANTPTECCQQLLPGLLAMLRSPLGSSDRLPVHAAKAVILLVALASHNESSVWTVPLEVQPLLLRWTPVVHLVYTHHPALLRWAIAQSPGAAPLEFLTALVTEWFRRDEKPQPVSELLRAHPSGLPCLLEVVQGSSNDKVATAAGLTVQLALSQQAVLREQLWLRLPVLLQRSFLPGSHGLALLLQLASQGLPDDPEVCNGVLSLVCTQLPTILTRASMHSNPWNRLAITTGLQVTRILLPAVNTSCVLNFVHHVGFMQCLQNAMNNVTEVKMCTAAIRLASQIILLPSETSLQFVTTAWVHGDLIINVLNDVLRQPELALAVLDLLAILPDPSPDVETRSVMCVDLKVEKSQIPKFADTLYRQLHFLTAKCSQVGYDDQVDAGWRCLLAVLRWRVSHTLALLPYTHTLVWTSTPPCSRAVYNMLQFACAWIALQCQERRQRVSKLRLLSSTVEHFLQKAEQFATYEGCLQLLINTLTMALQMENELGSRVVMLAKHKLEELQFLH